MDDNDVINMQSYSTKRRKIRANVARDIASVEGTSSVDGSIFEIPLAQSSYLPNEDDHFGGGVSSDNLTDKYIEPVYCDDISDYVEIEDLNPIISSDSEWADENSDVDDLRFKLSHWANQYNISHNSLAALLTILRLHFKELPKDPRTLLKTARTEEMEPLVKHISNGEYYHFGIAKRIESQLMMHNYEAVSNCIVSIQINVDGVPLFKSVGGQFWPILGKIDKPLVTEPFVIGIFYGLTKPSNLNYLTDFIDECCKLMKHGIVYGDFILNLGISAIVCDAPARAFLKNVKGHTAYSGCERCVQTGVWNGKLTYPDVKSRMRSDVSFDAMQDPDHHHGQSPLTDLGIGMVSQFVLDYMHLVCLGVVRRLIWLWISGPVAMRCRLGAKCILSISDKLVSFRSCMPTEFARKPRSLSEWQRWKATEFRQFLLYTGPVVLLGKLSDEAYKNFMLLSVGIFVLLDKSSSTADIDYAQQLLVLFVQHFSELYGPDMLVYNVHNVVHLADDARRYGPLDNVSAFCFENFLGKLVKLVRKPSKPLQQVVRRLLEQEQIETVKTPNNIDFSSTPQEEHNNGPIPVSVGISRQFRKVTIGGVSISLKPGNNCITMGRDIVMLCNIVVKDNETLLIYQKFGEQKSFFSYSWDSTRFRIYEVSNLQSKMFVGKPDNFKCKNVMLPHNGNYVVFPLLHV